MPGCVVKECQCRQQPLVEKPAWLRMCISFIDADLYTLSWILDIAPCFHEDIAHIVYSKPQRSTIP